MNARSTLVLSGVLALPLAAAAQQPDAPENRAALVHEHSSLDRGLPHWRATTLRLGRHWSARQLAEMELTRTRRFGLDDTEWAAGGAMPLGDALTGSLRLAHSPTHRVLAAASLAASLQYEFRRTWLLHGGLKHAHYDATDVDQATVMLEHYFGHWSAAAAVHHARAFDRGAGSAELRLARYYGEASSVGVFVSAGDQTTQAGPGALVFARVRSLALDGRHRLDGRWTLRYGLHRIRQGGFHTRTGALLGVQAAY